MVRKAFIPLLGTVDDPARLAPALHQKSVSATIHTAAGLAAISGRLGDLGTPV
jgi:hypothetical protein